MKFYISSFKIGSNPERLRQLLPEQPQAVYISNALDFASTEGKQKHVDWDLKDLSSIGIEAEPLDLREYFGKPDELKQTLHDIDLIYVSGGNVFDLRRAMQLSGFDEILKEFLPTDIVYAGYSAAGCVLSSTLRGYHIVDKPDLKTYGKHETMWEGLGIIDWMLAPHFESDHSESEDVNKEIAYYEKQNMKYTTLRDGEVLIFETAI